jgi:hypothetical protein
VENIAHSRAIVKVTTREANYFAVEYFRYRIARPRLIISYDTIPKPSQKISRGGLATREKFLPPLQRKMHAQEIAGQLYSFIIEGMNCL